MTAETPLWTAPELVAAVGGTVSARLPEALTGVSIDSRTLLPGDVFVALEGPSRDGHAFVADALARGAAAAIVTHGPPGLAAEAPLVIVDDTQRALERLADTARLRTSARIAAVTGSVGKTGTKEILARALAASAPTHASPGSYNNQWGVPLSLARMPRDMAYGVFELGMNHAGEITPLTHLVRPEVAIVTTIEAVHLEFFDSLEAIADAKAEIFEGVPGTGAAILNRDNPFYARVAGVAERRGIRRIIGFGEHPEAQVRLEAVELEPDGTRVRARLFDHEIEYRLGQPGRHLAMNSLAALAAVSALGADTVRAAGTLAAFTGLAGRGRRIAIEVEGGSATLIDESYNASPASVRAALAALPPAEGGRRIAVLGDMRELGAAAPAMHRELAHAVAAAGVDRAYLSGEFMAHLWAELPESCRGAWAPTARELLEPVQADLRSGDVVLVKGSLGSRMSDIVQPLIAGRTGREP